MNWSVVAQLVLSVTRKDGRALNLALVRASAAGWVCIAVEGNRVDGDVPVVETIGRVLDGHAHAQLPEKPSLAEAIAQAERYAKWWGRTGAKHEKCPCKVI